MYPLSFLYIVRVCKITNNVMNKDIKHRAKLNADQLQILEILSRYRYTTSSQIAQLQGKKSSEFVHKRLNILLNQEYIGRRYDSSFKLLGKPAAYYLTPKGARLLNNVLDTNLSVRTLYKDNTRSDGFIDHCINKLGLYLKLTAGDALPVKFFTSFELKAFSYMPKPLPDAYLRIKDKHYFLELYDTSKEFYPNLKNLKKYVAYEESDVWTKTGSDFPIVLVVCQDDKKALKLIEKLARYSSSISYAFSVHSELESINSKSWIIDEDKTRFALMELE